jgi:hypothetical protein
MQNKRSLGIVVAVLGVFVLAVSLLADALGIGGAAGAFGIKQIIGTAAGALLAIVGIVFAVHK